MSVFFPRVYVMIDTREDLFPHLDSDWSEAADSCSTNGSLDSNVSRNSHRALALTSFTGTSTSDAPRNLNLIFKKNYVAIEQRKKKKSITVAMVTPYIRRCLFNLNGRSLQYQYVFCHVKVSGISRFPDS